ncbi:hypothetical protein E8E11_010549 [Didymella keratinophila]|nr:hypothetical protein E8E11_010549 [Didymella keratinophila]
MPPEVHRIWLGLLPVSDLKNVRLLNKKLSAIAATILWSHLKIDLVETDNRKLSVLIDSSPQTGVLDNAKQLTITTEDMLGDPQERSQTTTNLIGLLSVLPRDCLTAFYCTCFPLRRNDLAVLLRIQSRLGDSSLCLAVYEQNGLPGTNHVRSNLSSLRKIHIVSSRSSLTYEGLVYWIPHASVLRELPSKAVYNSAELEQLAVDFPRLQKLGLDFGDFAGIIDRLEPLERSSQLIRHSNS